MVSIRALPPDDHLYAIRGDGVLYLPAVVLKPEVIYIDRTARVDSGCKLEGGEGIQIGPLVHVAFGCHLNVGGGTLIMEEGSSCGSRCVIVTGSGDYKAGVGCSAVSPNVVNTKGRVILKRNATLYAGCLVRPGVTIGEGATVAMGSVVLHDVPPGELWGGNPCRPLRDASGKPAISMKDPRSLTYGRHADNRFTASVMPQVDRFVEGQAEWYDQELR